MNTDNAARVRKCFDFVIGQIAKLGPCSVKRVAKIIESHQMPVEPSERVTLQDITKSGLFKGVIHETKNTICLDAERRILDAIKVAALKTNDDVHPVKPVINSADKSIRVFAVEHQVRLRICNIKMNGNNMEFVSLKAKTSTLAHRLKRARYRGILVDTILKNDDGRDHREIVRMVSAGECIYVPTNKRVYCLSESIRPACDFNHSGSKHLHENGTLTDSRKRARR